MYTRRSRLVATVIGRAQLARIFPEKGHDVAGSQHCLLFPHNVGTDYGMIREEVLFLPRVQTRQNKNITS